MFKSHVLLAPATSQEPRLYLINVVGLAMGMAVALLSASGSRRSCCRQSYPDRSRIVEINADQRPKGTPSGFAHHYRGMTVSAAVEPFCKRAIKTSSAERRCSKARRCLLANGDKKIVRQVLRRGVVNLWRSYQATS